MKEDHHFSDLQFITFFSLWFNICILLSSIYALMVFRTVLQQGFDHVNLFCCSPIIELLWKTILISRY
ncbi:hypothetical protein HN51_008708 [Arachis hypogaea]